MKAILVLLTDIYLGHDIKLVIFLILNYVFLYYYIYNYLDYRRTENTKFTIQIINRPKK